MSNYRRPKASGAIYFTTIVTFKRRRFLCSATVRSALRLAIRETQKILPFKIIAWVLLPDHMHCIWLLPFGDNALGKRWGMIKKSVTQRCPELHRQDWMTPSKRKRRESTLWQRRFWEHQIRDEKDLENHFNYIHWNPVKHGLCERPTDWPYSTIHRYRGECWE